MTFFATNIFFVFYWGWDCFYFYFIFQSIFFKCFFCCMLYYVSIIWIYCIWSCCLHNVISIFRSYYCIFRCYFNDSSCWIYYYWLPYMCNSFSIVLIYCVSRCGGLTSVFSWNSNIILTFFATSIFFVFYWGWDCFYFYFIFHPIFLEHFIKCIFSSLSCIRIFHTHSCWLNDVISAFTIYSSFSNFFYRFNCCNFFILITCPI